MKSRVLLIWKAALDDGKVITVLAVVVAECWRNQRGPIARLLEYVEVEPVTAFPQYGC